MKLSKKSTGGPVVGLDLGAGSIAATELTAGGPGLGKVEKAVVGPLQAGAFAEGEIVDAEALSSALKEFFAEHKLSKRVRLGIANQKLAVRNLRLPLVENPEEMESAVRFKAQEELPMPLDQAVLDHRIVAHSQDENGGYQVDVIVVAARRDMIETFLGAMRGAGLRPIGIDLSAFGMIRALADRKPVVADNGERQPVPTTLFCSVGDGANLAFARGRSCLMTRVSPYGSQEMAEELVARGELSLEHARDWLSYVGLQKPVSEVDAGEEGAETVLAAREVLEAGSARLLDEIRLSLDFYAQQPDVPPVEQLVLSGEGAAIPGLAEQLADGLGLALRKAEPAALSETDSAKAARLATSYGLALDE